MLNIISRTNYTPQMGGAIKVFKNLVKGLDRLKYPYVVNKAVDSCEYLWVHDDYRVLLSLRGIDPRVRIVLGPNMFVMPRDIHRKSYFPASAVYLQPCKWAMDSWLTAGFKDCRMDWWPVGIDIDSLPRRPATEGDRVLLYVKQRWPDDLPRVEQALRDAGLRYSTIVYGHYRQDDFINELLHSRFVVWFGRHESQGLALQEAMAMDRPILVVDVATLHDFDPGPDGYRFTPEELDQPVTAAPYFDERCGIKIPSVEQLPAALEEMAANFHNYRPREFVEQNLSLEKGAQDLLNLYTKWWDGPPQFVVNEKYLPRFVPRPDWVQIPIERRLRNAVARVRRRR